MIKNIFKVSRQFSQVSSLSKGELEQKIIQASLLHIEKTGFTDEALSRACDDLDLSSASNRIVEAGPISIVHHIIDESEILYQRQFLKKYGEIQFGEKNPREIE